jgi:hypothetical protein
VYNRLVRECKKLYFDTEFDKHKSNLKVTWDLLRKAIRKSKLKKCNIQSINSNGTFIYESKAIADNFNMYFTTIADSIADEIHPTVRPPNTQLTRTCPFLISVTTL